MSDVSLPSNGTAFRQYASFVGLVTSGLLALLGQAALAANWDRNALPGLISYAAAIAVFLWGLRHIPDTPNFQPETEAFPRRPPRFGLWLTTLALTLWLAALASQESVSPEQGRLMTIIWPINIGLLSWSVLRLGQWHFPKISAMLEGWRKHSYETLAVTLLVSLAFALRIYDLELHPYAMINDEGEVGKQALSILAGEQTNFFEAGWSGQPLWSFVPDAITTWLFGRTAFAVRFVSAVQGTLAVLFLYLLAREIFDPATGLIAAAILGTLPFHIHFSRLGVGNGSDSFFVTLVLWLTFRAIRRGRLSSYLWAGLAAGLTLYSYLGSRLVMALAIGAVGYAAVYYRLSVQTHLRQWLVFAAALGVVAAPIGAYFLSHPGVFLSRINAEVILYNGWLEQRAAEGKLASALQQQVGRSTMVYLVSDALHGFYNAPRPYFPPLAAILGMLGLGYALRHVKEPRYMVLLAWFWAVVLLGSILTVGAPTSQRLIMSAPAAALLVALGVRKTASLLQAAMAELRIRLPGISTAFTVLVVCVTAWQGIAFYFVEYPNGHFFEDHSNELTYEASRYVNSLGPQYRLYLIGDPIVYAIFGNFSYLAAHNICQDFNEITPEALAALPRQGGAFFVAFPSRRQDLQTVADLLPGGTLLEVPRRFQPAEVLYDAYLLPPEVFENR